MFYLVYKLSYKYFKFRGRILHFSISGFIVPYSPLALLDAQTPSFVTKYSLVFPDRVVENRICNISAMRYRAGL